MLLDRPDEGLDSGDRDRGEPLDDGEALLRRDATSPSIGDESGGVERAEVAAGGDVLGAEIEADSRRLERTPADAEGEWVVAEEAEMSRTRSRRDAGQDGRARAP